MSARIVVVIRRLALASLTMLALVATVGPKGADAAAPRIVVDPSTVPRGSQVAVYGAGFCATSGCSTVTITVAQRVAASGVAVKSDGSFAAAATITENIGTYPVTATQSTPDGTNNQATTQLKVAAGDQIATTTTITASNSTVPRGGTQSLTTRPPAPTGSSASTAPPSGNPAGGQATTSTTPTTTTTALGPKQESARPIRTASPGGPIWPWVLLAIAGLVIIAGIGTAVARRHR